MHNLILFIKSYKPDFDRVNILLASIKKFNKDKLPVFLSINDTDFDFFKAKISDNITILKDSDVITCKITDPWRYQQVIKASVHKLNICKNYLCIDSDSKFIRDFYSEDFIYKDDLPYTVMHESKAFLEVMERINLDSNLIFFKETTLQTRKLLQIKDTNKIWDFGPSPYLWSTKVWIALENHLANMGFTFESFLMEISKTTSPSENAIYGEFLRTHKTIEILPIGPFFKVYHYKKQFLMERKFHKIDKLKKVYLGVIFQTNWRRNFIDKFLKRF